MDKFKIRIYPSAEADLLEIIEYLNTLSQTAALRYFDLIINKIGSLSEMPERCPLIKDPLLRNKGYRLMQIKSYNVFYVILSNEIQIRRILYNKRDYDNISPERS